MLENVDLAQNQIFGIFSMRKFNKKKKKKTALEI